MISSAGPRPGRMGAPGTYFLTLRDPGLRCGLRRCGAEQGGLLASAEVLGCKQRCALRDSRTHSCFSARPEGPFCPALGGTVKEPCVAKSLRESCFQVQVWKCLTPRPGNSERGVTPSWGGGLGIQPLQDLGLGILPMQRMRV